MSTTLLKSVIHDSYLSLPRKNIQQNVFIGLTEWHFIEGLIEYDKKFFEEILITDMY